MKTWGFLVAIESAIEITKDGIDCILSEAFAYEYNVIHIDCEALGEIDCYEESNGVENGTNES